LLTNAEIGKALGKQARRTIVEKFSRDKMVKDTLKVYESVVKK
jgi:hypothetical protein